MRIVRYCSVGCVGHYSWYKELDGYKCAGTGVGEERYPPGNNWSYLVLLIPFGFVAFLCWFIFQSG